MIVCGIEEGFSSLLKQPPVQNYRSSNFRKIHLLSQESILYSRRKGK